MNGALLREAFEDDSLRSAAGAALWAIDEPAIEIDPLHRGNRKQTAIARFDEHGPVVVQVCDELTWLRTETTLLTAICERSDVPVPPVLSSGIHDGVAYTLTAYVVGDDLHERFTSLDPETRLTLVRTFGSYLAQLHEAFQFDGYGTLVRTDGTLAARRDDWGAWFRGYGHRVVERLPAGFEPLRTELRELLADWSPTASPSARLYPWDFRPGNALVADGTITAVLDWEAPLAAPPSLSVAKAEYLVADWYVSGPEPLREAFRSGYASVRPYPSVPATHRVAAIADSAVDSAGTVTNPRYPELDHDDAVRFHRRALENALESERSPERPENCLGSE